MAGAAGGDMEVRTCYGFGARRARSRRRRAQPRARVAVEVATAVKKSTPVQIEALGTVTPIASVAIKSRIDSEITDIHFADGARVKQGDVLITLDSRAIEAQILQAEGNIARDKAQLEGAERDIAATPSWWRRTRRRSPISTTPRPRPRSTRRR